MALTIAYIANADTVQPSFKKETAKQRLHRLAIESLAARKIHDRAKAKALFKPLWDEVLELERKHEKLLNRVK